MRAWPAGVVGAEGGVTGGRGPAGVRWTLPEWCEVPGSPALTQPEAEKVTVSPVHFMPAGVPLASSKVRSTEATGGGPTKMSEHSAPPSPATSVVLPTEIGRAHV